MASFPPWERWLVDSRCPTERSRTPCCPFRRPRRSWDPSWRQRGHRGRRRGPVALRPRLSPGVPLSGISCVGLRYGAVPRLSITEAAPRQLLRRPHHLSSVGERDLSLRTVALAGMNGRRRRWRWPRSGWPGARGSVGLAWAQAARANADVRREGEYLQYAAVSFLLPPTSYRASPPTVICRPVEPRSRKSLPTRLFAPA
jgi:hypothetical protein